MKFKTPIPIHAIAKKYGASIIGDSSLEAKGINEIHKVEEGDITFSDHPKYFAKALHSAASIILLNEEVACPPGKALLICDQPFEVYNSIVSQFAPKEYLSNDNSANLIHPSVILEPNVVIGPQVRIGANTWIQSNVVIRGPVHIGKHVVVQSGAVIGGDAFYFKKYFDHYKKWRSGGRVIVKDRVDIGPNCTIARGVSGDTIIGKGTKLDAQVQIGHGVVLGNNCLLAAQVGIGGKTILEDDVVCYGQVGIAQNLRIGRGAIISAKSGVSKSLKGGKTYAGIPAQEIRSHYQQKAALKNLPEWMKKKG